MRTENLQAILTRRPWREGDLGGIIDELNHRVKNMLATVQSLARQILRGPKVDPDRRAAFEDRLLALAGAHDVLTRESWEHADMKAIIDEVVAPHCGRSSSASARG
jgi:two-component sensor histidine kinase